MKTPKTKRKSKPVATAEAKCHSDQRLVRPLDELLKEVSELFCQKQSGTCYTYDFHLGRFPDGWTFQVVNDWHRWIAAGRKTEFGRYETPEAALIAFLEYRRENQINVAGLMA